MEFLRASLINGGRLYVNYQDLLDWLEDLSDLSAIQATQNPAIGITYKETLKTVRQDLKKQRKSLSI